MVSSFAIKRLSEQLDALEQRFKPPFKSIFVPVGEGVNKESVLARHFELYPEDRDPDLLVYTIYEGDYRKSPDVKANRAWLDIEQEQEARQ